MKAFNLRLAEEGKLLADINETLYKFIGMTSTKLVVVETVNTAIISTFAKEDIFMAPIVKRVWVNMYPNYVAYHYDTKAEANDSAISGRLFDKPFSIDINE